MTRVGALLVVLAASGLSAACNDELVDEVDASVCKSGLRWIGGNRGSEEMRPGGDCVGCHKDNDGPPLVFGGTLYRDADRGPNGPGDPTSEEAKRECYGLEGVTVTVRGSDGRKFVAETNRAGNFFYEGQEEELVKPYTVETEYVFPDGTPARPQMFRPVHYGGCARCHGTQTEPPTTAEPGLEPRDSVVLTNAISVQSPTP